MAKCEIKMFEYEEEIDLYAKILQDFIDQYELPESWFAFPDHIAIKCADALSYEYTLQELLADAQQVSEVNMDGRRLAALLLSSALPVGSHGNVSWVEIMEPRPEKLGKGLVGIEHMEFSYPDSNAIREVLEANGIRFTEQSNPGHQWINIVLNDTGQELKLNNLPLRDIVEKELADGTAHLLA